MADRYNVNDLEMVQDDYGMWYYELHHQPYTGNAYALFPVSGTLSHEFNLEKGYRQGLQRQWYENGQLMSESFYDAGVPHGASKEWFENGVLHFEAEFDYFKSIWSKSYDQNSELIEEMKN